MTALPAWLEGVLDRRDGAAAWLAREVREVLAQ